MELGHLTDDALDHDTTALARSEREILTKILHHLREVERRRLFAKYQLSSLFHYATERMGYSEDQAARRISAMRLLRELPLLEEKIEDGSLTLTQLARAQTLFRQEKKVTGLSRTAEEKLALLTQIENTSKRETDETLEREATIERPFDFAGFSAVTIYQFAEPVRAKLARLVELKHENAANVEPLVGELADLGLERWDPLKRAERARTRSKGSEDSNGNGNEKREEVLHSNDVSVLVAKAVALKSRSVDVEAARRNHIPAAVRHHVVLRDGGECRFCKTGRNLEIDHIVPVALGGTNDPDNLRLVCRSCNQRAAIERFGVEKMEPYLDS